MDLITNCVVCKTPEPELLETLKPGQVICVTCGWAYDDNPVIESKLNLAREFWDTFHQFVCHGTLIGMGEGVKLWCDWLDDRRLKRLR